ncbi:CocE/NonD family hydrolase [Amycolatopsis sp. H20-H5]|uniref:CocE/NonD family hydrolase n=1 Tax=Amycolatopsis sp. H20-H5 TaxID=3046309 RepID=UPI002DB8B0A6|nr:CocE/NonD family hydrolase [Amycolatopsis sp. H20-H5]MEC3978025.1 CocE/NonD family hydrolase [Amycolatopsis sp. H20-H5]
MVREGKLAGPVAGLQFDTPTCSGVTDHAGTFRFRDGEVVTFSVGRVMVGVVRGAERLTIADLVARVDGNLSKVADPALTNIARFLLTLDEDGNPDNGITVSPQMHELVADRAIDFRYQVMSLPGAPADPVQAFTDDPVVAQLLEDLNQSKLLSDAVPRALTSPAAARNEVRRNILGIRRFRDVKIPLRNGSFVYADVFRPDSDEPVPVVMNCGVYGRAFVHHSICDEQDAERHEAMEDRYFRGNPDGYEYENHESINTATWIPRGYALVRVDSPGAGKSPGTLGIWGIGEAEAYYDAIEWAGAQPWSNGNVGLWGMSYYAVNQHAVASLRPPHLKAMIAIGTDTDLYEEVAYTGGILNEEFFPGWFANGIVPAICGDIDATDFLAAARATPFKDSDPAAIFGPRSEVLMSPDLTQVDTPLWAVAATAHPANFHQLGSSETYLNTPTPNKKIDFWEDWFVKSYSATAVEDHVAFFDHWLKGADNGIMDTPPVRLEIRTGRGGSYLQEEHEWPIARTEYVKWYLDATPPHDEHNGCDNVGRLIDAIPVEQQSVTYSADVEDSVAFSAEVDVAEVRRPPAPTVPADTMTAAPCSHGATFLSAPFEDDTVLAGYSKLVVWVASTSHDMDIFVALRVLDEHDREVDFCGPALIPGISTRFYPLAKGWLKASHRALDLQRSTNFRPKHTHLRADHAPLREDEIVPVEVEIIPNTCVIRKGQRLRVDIQPYTGTGHGMRHAYDRSYHVGARNTIFTGPEYPSYMQLPVVPAAEA